MIKKIHIPYLNEILKTLLDYKADNELNTFDSIVYYLRIISYIIQMRA